MAIASEVVSVPIWFVDHVAQESGKSNVFRRRKVMTIQLPRNFLGNPEAASFESSHPRACEKTKDFGRKTAALRMVHGMACSRCPQCCSSSLPEIFTFCFCTFSSSATRTLAGQNIWASVDWVRLSDLYRQRP